PPPGTKAFALLLDDPDAPKKVWVHWVVFNLPAASRSLKEHVPTDETLPDGSRQGKNDFGKIGYGGPAPPAGKPHRYLFHLYALDAPLELEPGASKQQLLESVKEHLLAKADLTGTYARGHK